MHFNVVHRVDPTYAATQAHFADLLERYSSPVIVLNLVKQREKREREGIVGRSVHCSGWEWGGACLSGRCAYLISLFFGGQGASPCH